MISEEARPFVRSLFAAFGKQITDAMLEEYADVIVRSVCEPCAIAVFDRMRKRGILGEDDKPMRVVPPAPDIARQIAREGGSVQHANHLGSSARENDAASVEAFWRQRAISLIRPHAGGDDLARYVAAQMWWVGIAPTLDAVEWELRDEMSRQVWIGSARAFAGSKDTRVLTEAAFERARARHTHGEDGLPHALVDLAVSP